jgi:PAS domain S-box-containing protein
MTDTGVIGQLLQLKDALNSLHDEESVLNIVCHDLAFIPGVDHAEFSHDSMYNPPDHNSVLFCPVMTGDVGSGYILLHIKNRVNFMPYREYVEDFMLNLNAILRELRHKKNCNQQGGEQKVLIRKQTGMKSQEGEDLADIIRSFSAIMKNIHLPAVLLNTKGQIEYCNPCLLDIAGYAREEVYGRNWFDLFIADAERENLKNKFMEALKGSFDMGFNENPILTRKDREIPVSWNNTILRNSKNEALGIASIGEYKNSRKLADVALIDQRDKLWELNEEYLSVIHELKMANRQILELNRVLIEAKSQAEESEQRYKTLYNNTPVMLQSVNMKGEIVSVNEYWLECTGYSREEVMGSQVTDYLTVESREYYRKMLPEFINKGVIDNQEGRALKKNGEAMDLLMSSKLLYDQDGNPAATMTKLIDITFKKKAEQEQKILNQQLLAAKEKAEESDRLKTAFLQNLSHEIRTPMNAICGFSQLILNTIGNDPKLNRYTSYIVNSSNQLLTIVNNILTLSALETKQERITISCVNVNSIMNEMHDIYLNLTQHRNINLKMTKSLSNEQAEIYTDNTKLRQILVNLLNNAVKFTPEGEINFGYDLNNGFMEFFVKDNGIGISPDKLQIIFERFRQANDSIGELFGGTGLGLTISKAFVELLGGQIWVTSEPSKRSDFRFTIPYNTRNPED